MFNTPTGFTGVSYTVPTQLSTNTYLLRTDWQINNAHRVSVRGSGFTWSNPFTNVTGTNSPTRSTDAGRTNYSVLGIWTWTATPALVNEVRAGLNHFDWANDRGPVSLRRGTSECPGDSSAGAGCADPVLAADEHRHAAANHENWTVSADFVHWRVYHDWVRGDANLFYNSATAGSLFDALQLGCGGAGTWEVGRCFHHQNATDIRTSAFGTGSRWTRRDADGACGKSVSWVIREGMKTIWKQTAVSDGAAMIRLPAVPANSARRLLEASVNGASLLHQAGRPIFPVAFVVLVRKIR